MQVRRLGSYELVRPLGEGGMAQVYLARDVRLGREVAVKVLDPQLAERPGFRERFLREARVAAALDQPNIVPLFDFGESDGNLYLVMPYVSGGSLQDELRRAPLPPGEVAKYGSQIADALDYAHQRGVVHRDVKPANMLIHADGRLMLSDFGLAKILDGTPRPHVPRGRPDAGTPEYMAPEQVEGNTDARSDIYALGVVLYLLLTGHLPFSGATANAVMEGHLYRLPEPPRALNPAVSVAMQEVVLRALAKHPDDRYQRAGDLGAALLSALVAGDVEPLPFGVGGPSSPMSLPIVTPEPARSAPMRSGATAADWNPPQLDPAGRPLVPMSGAWTSTARPDGRTGGSVTGGPPPGMPLGGLPGGGTGMSGVGMSGTTGALARNRLTQGAASAGTGVGAVGAPLASNGGALSPAFPLAPGVFPMAGRTSGPAPMSQPLPPLPPLDGPAPAAQQEPSRQAAMGQPAPASVPLPPMGTRGAGASLEYRPSRANALWPWLVVVVVLAVVAVVLLVMASHGHEAGWEAAPEALRAMVAGGRGRA